VKSALAKPVVQTSGPAFVKHSSNKGYEIASLLSAVEVLDYIIPRAPSHFLESSRVFAQRPYCFGERRVVARFDKDSGARRFNNLSDHAVDRKHRRTRRGHVVKDLVWIRGSEHRNVLQRGDANVARRQPRRDLALGARSGKRDVVQPHLRGNGIEPD